jgi:hypothetical protein
VSTAALTITAMMGVAAVPAWEDHGRCDGHEGDHGRSCLPTSMDECEDGGRQPFDLFKNLFEDRSRCA